MTQGLLEGGGRGGERMQTSSSSAVAAVAAVGRGATRSLATGAVGANAASAGAVAVKLKKVREVCRKPSAHWVGDGFNVWPVFANKAFTKAISPFLMFDYAAPKEFPAALSKRGVGMHPHRGFETITIAFQGSIEHGDSKGNRGVIGPGDVQWMTAGKGIVHEEFHSREFAKEGGTLEMCQLWLNLPAKYKMVEPRYQAILKGDIPQVPLVLGGEGKRADEGDGYCRVIAGNFEGTEGAAATHSPVNLWDVKLATPGTAFDFGVGEGHNTVIFVRRGKILVEGNELGQADVAILGTEGNCVRCSGVDANSEFLVLSGLPFDEPIAARGPFVMNTAQELMEAIRDFQSGTNGFEGSY